MDNNIIQAYLWQEVIRLAFSPTGSKDIKSWLLQYGQSLPVFWEIDNYPLAPKSNGAITAELSCASSLNLSLTYNVTNIAKFAVTFSTLPSKNDKIWVHDVDSSYFSFPELSLLLKYGKERTAIKKMSNQHLKKVLDGLIFHPTAHQHIKNEIRIGGGINNPFLYLFHLRYQLCTIPEKQEEERLRIINLFESAVKNKKQVTPNELFSDN